MSNLNKSMGSVKMTPQKYFLGALFGVAVLASLYRYYIGLGTTNLSDSYPWGLWIAVDLIVTALACVGFSMTLVSKIFHQNEFKDLTKRAVLMALLCYVLISLVLIVEIGRWDNFWRPIFSPGVSSPMFLVLLCVGLYSLLLVLESYEILGERANFKHYKKVKAIMPVIVIVACAVPVAYQASLGSIYFAMEGKLSPLWSSFLSPFFFVLSAFMVGFAVMIIEALTISKSLLTENGIVLLQKLSKVATYSTIVFLLVKILDLLLRGQLGLLGTTEGIYFILELIFISVIPLVIYFTNYGKTKKGLLVFALSMVLGLCLTRLNIIFTGMNDYLGGGYYPSLIEILTTVGFIAFVSLLYLLIIEKFQFLKK